MSDDENKNENPQQGDPAQLGDAGKAALVAERKRADDAERAKKDAEQKLADLEAQGLSDLEKARRDIDKLTKTNAELTAQVEGLTLQNVKLNVGIEAGLPKDFIGRLQGTDEATFKADAESLKALVPDTSPSPFPKADPSQGAKGKTGTPSTAEQFASVVGKQLT